MNIYIVKFCIYDWTYLCNKNDISTFIVPQKLEHYLYGFFKNVEVAFARYPFHHNPFTNVFTDYMITPIEPVDNKMDIKILIEDVVLDIDKLKCKLEFFVEDYFDLNICAEEESKIKYFKIYKWIEPKMWKFEKKVKLFDYDFNIFSENISDNILEIFEENIITDEDTRINREELINGCWNNLCYYNCCRWFN